MIRQHSALLAQENCEVVRSSGFSRPSCRVFRLKAGLRTVVSATLQISCLLAVLICLAAFGRLSPAAVVLETDCLRLEISDDGLLRSVASKPDAVECADLTQCSPIAMIYRGGRMKPLGEGEFAPVTARWVYEGGQQIAATGVAIRNDRLTIEFGPAQVKAECLVRRRGDYLAIELCKLDGPPIDRIEFFRLRFRQPSLFGQWVGLAGDDRFAVCLCGANLNTNLEAWPEDEHAFITAAAESSVGWRGATAVLFGCREPRTRFLDVMAQVESDFHLPAGAAFRRSPLQRLSYLWASPPNPQNIDDYIRFAKQGGFRMLLLSYRAFSDAPGHFAWNKHYPGGMADLKRVTDAVRQAGLKLGLHIHYCKAGKTDAYVTPVPDERLHVERSFTLAAALTADATTVAVQEHPAGCTLDKGRRLLKLEKELIEYERYTGRAPFQFLGALGTTAASHRPDAKLGLLDVDTWPAFIRFDQTTDIQDETARRIADIYHQSGPYDMVYFDGAEDVHEPYWHHVPAAQYRVFRRLSPPPPVCESAQYTHFSWHMISRSNAYDVVAPPDGMKDFCRLMPCPTAAARTADFSRIDFGWLGRFGAAKSGAPGPDVFEYVASRAAAWDCPLSLHATVTELKSNPRGDDCLAALKLWEDARLGDQLTDADRLGLRNVAPADAHYVPCFVQRRTYQNARDNRDLTPAQKRILADRREHHLFRNEQGRCELVEVESVPNAAQGAVTAYLFRRASQPNCVYALAATAKDDVRLRIPQRGVTAMRPFGANLVCRSVGDATEVTIGPRTYLVFADTTLEAARDLLRRAQVVR